MWAFLVVHWWLPFLISIVIGCLFIAFTGLEIGDGMGGFVPAMITTVLGYFCTNILFHQRFDVIVSLIPKN